VARAVVNYNTCTADVLNNQGVSVGLLVFYGPGLQRFIGQVTGKVLTLLSSVASFKLDVTHVAETEHLRYLSIGEQPVSGEVQIVARHGVKFSVSDEGVLSLDVLGDPVSSVFSRDPIRSINGVRNMSIWLEGHPRANLRISSAGGQVSFIAARDAT